MSPSRRFESVAHPADAALSALAALAASTLAAACAPATRAEAPGAPVVVRDLESARELDRQGVQSFRDGRFADAARYFRAALERGGPSSELWNIARCEEHRDDPEAALAALGAYLARSDLSPADRAEAAREAQAIRGRPSPLTVVTRPSGAAVWVDGQRVPGVTPVSFAVSPGRHEVKSNDPRLPDSKGLAQSVEASLGRAIVVVLDLAPERK